MKPFNTRSATLAGGLTRRITGQGLTEYIIILALVCVAAIIAVSYFGDAVKANFLALGADLTGGQAVNKVALTAESQGRAITATEGVTNLGNYNENN